MYKSGSAADRFGDQQSAHKVPKGKIKNQKEDIGLAACLAWRTGTPRQIELQWESPGKGIGNGGENIRSPKQAGYNEQNEGKKDLEKSGLEDCFHDLYSGYRLENSFIPAGYVVSDKPNPC